MLLDLAPPALQLVAALQLVVGIPGRVRERIRVTMAQARHVHLVDRQVSVARGQDRDLKMVVVAVGVLVLTATHPLATCILDNAMKPTTTTAVVVVVVVEAVEARILARGLKLSTGETRSIATKQHDTDALYDGNSSGIVLNCSNGAMACV